MSVETFGFDNLQNRLLAVAERDAPRLIDESVERQGMQIVADVKQGSPVRAESGGGNLKRKWTIGVVSNGAVEIGTNVDYALPVEKGFIHNNGGFKVKGVHMLEKAVENGRRRLPGEMDRLMSAIRNELGL
ncbi:HK97 gp10 family phage protein [Geomicrobium sediminis]|uniref:HK97 gp10 family phage protein n=1 Tax=Geomicrobium sediminis TaxID=1347788 RepID=A0ABS2P6T2_9BACL|nr:hypothetical protein [Geomicrobium sediminis]